MKALILLFICSKLFSYTYVTSTKAAFKTDEVKVYFADYGCSNTGIADTELEDLIREALDMYWNTVPTSSLKMTFAGSKTVSTDFQTQSPCLNTTGNCEINPNLIFDGGILIGCSQSTDLFTSSAILGNTLVNNYSGDTIKGSIFLINDLVDNNFQLKSWSEKRAIIAHELGHAIGLGHSSTPESLMYYKSIAFRDTLGLDDILGVTSLYPAKISSSCATISTKQGIPPSSAAPIGLIVGILLITIHRRFYV